MENSEMVHFGGRRSQEYGPKTGGPRISYWRPIISLKNLNPDASSLFGGQDQGSIKAAESSPKAEAKTPPLFASL